MYISRIITNCWGSVPQHEPEDYKFDPRTWQHNFICYNAVDGQGTIPVYNIRIKT